MTNLQSNSAADLISAQLQAAVAKFGFQLLATRGNSLVKTLVLAQDNTANNPFGDTTAVGESLVGATLDVTA